MQADEVQPVVGQDRALFNGRCGEDLFIGQASPGEAEHCESEDVVPERAQARRDAVIEVFVGEKERYQAAAFSVSRRSISCRCSL